MNPQFNLRMHFGDWTKCFGCLCMCPGLHSCSQLRHKGPVCSVENWWHTSICQKCQKILPPEAGMKSDSDPFLTGSKGKDWGSSRSKCKARRRSRCGGELAITCFLVIYVLVTTDCGGHRAHAIGAREHNQNIFWGVYFLALHDLQKHGQTPSLQILSFLVSCILFWPCMVLGWEVTFLGSWISRFHMCVFGHTSPSDHTECVAGGSRERNVTGFLQTSAKICLLSRLLLKNWHLVLWTFQIMHMQDCHRAAINKRKEDHSMFTRNAKYFVLYFLDKKLMDALTDRNTILTQTL